MTDRECIYNLVDKVCDLSIKAIDKITKLKQENNKLKQRIAELEKPKKKRKFRAMTCREFCRKYKSCENCPEYNSLFCCDIMCAIDGAAPYKTKYNKYILIER